MSKRGEMLKGFLERNFSQNTITQCADILKNMTEQQKEEKAGQILIMLNKSESEKHFISMMKEVK